jgi:2-polyprenyl-6-methoxyphenol hydroxylase-like FAD-dependent oxidoreductase
MSSFTVIIIGGGLAGSLLGNELVNHAIDCAVYEKDPHGSKREGYQIQLGASALVELQACLEKM